MAKSLIIVKKDKRRERIVFTILCVLIAILLVFNIVALVYILTHNTKHGSPSFIADNKYVIGYVKAGGEYTKNTITFDDELLFPGTQTTKTVRFENYGGKNYYIRIYAQFQVNVNGKSFETQDNFVEINITNGNTKWIKSATDEKIYFTDEFAGHSEIDVDLTINLRNSLDNDDFNENYKDKPYRLNICIETTNTNITLDKTPEGIENSWK